MDTTYTDEQLLLRETADQMATELGARPDEINSQRGDDKGPGLLSETGLYGMRLPESLGGVGATAVDVAIVAESFASTAAVVPFVGPALASDLVARLDPGAAAELADDAARLTIALGDDFLYGAARLQIAWDSANAATALQVDLVGSICRVARLTIGDEIAGADLSRSVHEALSADQLAEFGTAEFEGWLAFALTCVSADLIGVMSGSLDLALDHLKNRNQFGRPLGAFQALQHLVADAYVLLEGARSGVLHSAWAVDNAEPGEALMAARVAKAYCAGAALKVTETAMQVHGGMGITWESPCHLFLRRAYFDNVTLGDEQVQLAEIADARLGATA
jgi:alkylation response protein AidB-like acyl-CoA dehydrogenase